MKLKVRKLGEVAVIDVGDNILMADDGQFRSALLNVLKEGCVNLVVNFTGTDYLCSTSLGTMAMVIKRVRERGGDLKIANIGSKVRKFFEVTRLVRMLDVFESVEDAVRAFTEEKEEG